MGKKLFHAEIWGVRGRAHPFSFSFPSPVCSDAGTASSPRRCEWMRTERSREKPLFLSSSVPAASTEASVIFFLCRDFLLCRVQPSFLLSRLAGRQRRKRPREWKTAPRESGKRRDLADTLSPFSPRGAQAAIGHRATVWEGKGEGLVLLKAETE